MLNWFAPLGLLISLIFLSGCSTLQSSQSLDEQIEEFVKLVDDATPIELLFTANINANPNWPLNGSLNRNDITSSQRTCVRAYFQSHRAKYYKLEKARIYAQERGSDLKNDINLLKYSFGKRSKAFFTALAEGRHEDFKPDNEMIQLLLNPEYSDLRHILLLDSTEESSGIAKNMAFILYSSLHSCGIQMQQSF